MLLLRTVLYILVENASARGSMDFMCLVFSLSGPCDLLFCFLLLQYICV